MSSDIDDTGVDFVTAFHPPADISPAQFEEFVAQLFNSAAQTVDDLDVAVHEPITGVDGTYNFDAVVRYRWAGTSFLVIVEAKRHKNPVKREAVQALHQKAQSIGATKALWSRPRRTSAALSPSRRHTALPSRR